MLLYNCRCGHRILTEDFDSAAQGLINVLIVN